MFFEKFRQIILSISICTFGCHKPYFCQVYRFLTRIAHLKVSWSRFSQFRFVKMSSCVPPHEPVFHHFSSPHFLWFSSRLFNKFLQISISSKSILFFSPNSFSLLFFFIFFHFVQSFQSFSKRQREKCILFHSGLKTLAVGRSEAAPFMFPRPIATTLSSLLALMRDTSDDTSDATSTNRHMSSSSGKDVTFDI